MSAEPSLARTRIYVSFADEDRAQAMGLVRWLNDSGWRVVADDRHSFAPGDRWSRSLRLDSCDVALCLIAPGWLASKHCHDEYADCTKLGKLVLPVICERFDLNLLPESMRVLPRVDLTQDRLNGYLVLKDALQQAGSRVETLVAAEREAAHSRRWPLRLLAAAVWVLASVLAIWLLSWR
jgi:TIR domain-containing protein